MEIVTDASAIIAVVANEPSKSELIKLTRGADLIAPHSIHWEIGNAFSAMLKRRRVTLSQALDAIVTYESIPLRVVSVELDEALKIASELNIYAYDAYLVRCALKYRAPLLTLDGGLKHAARQKNVQVLEIER